MKLEEMEAYASARHCKVELLDRDEGFKRKEQSGADRFEIWLTTLRTNGECYAEEKMSFESTQQEAIDQAWLKVKKEADDWAANRK